MNAPFPDLHHLRFPGESADYRAAARNALLAEEMELRRQTERVAAQRRTLPAGGALAENYLFEGPDGPVKLSELFTLAIYSFMYGPEREEPCPDAPTSWMASTAGWSTSLSGSVSRSSPSRLCRASSPWRGIARLAPAASAVHGREHL